MVVLDFTIEPFIGGRPGKYVSAAVAAAEALGVEVEFGPFGTTCTVDESRIGEVVKAVVDAAVANGASHISLHVATEAAKANPDGGQVDG